MSSIYENAYLTIAATAAPNSDAGIFSARPRPIKLKYQSSSRAKEYKLCARKVPDHHPITTTPSSTPKTAQPPSPPSGPLRTRAWALQEHVLCSRILHYTTHELLFECRLTSSCECRASSRKLPQATTPRLLPNLLITGKKDAYWRTWHTIIQAYTARELTVPADKLPAISGIAKGLLRGVDGGAKAYVCGLWRANLVGDLLWASLGGGKGARGLGTEPEAWRAPSWSWVSVDGEVSYEWVEGERVAELVKVKDVRVVPSGRNPLGAVGKAWLKLVGPVVEVELHAKVEGGQGIKYCLRRSGHSDVIDVVPDTLLTPAQYGGGSSTESAAAETRRARSGETSTEFNTKVLCLGIARYESSWIAGIVLGAAEWNGKRGYERLGVFGCGDEWFIGAGRREVLIL